MEKAERKNVKALFPLLPYTCRTELFAFLRAEPSYFLTPVSFENKIITLPLIQIIPGKLEFVFTVPQATLLTVLHSTSGISTVMNCTLPQETVPYCTAQYLSKLYHTVLHSTVGICPILYSAVRKPYLPYCTAQYCRQLPNTVLYYTTGR